MSLQTHEQILTEQFDAVLADAKLWTELYEKTRSQNCLIEAAKSWGMLRGLAIAAAQFGIGSLRERLRALEESEIKCKSTQGGEK